MAGEDVMIIERGERYATVNGIDGPTVQDLPICTVAAQVKSNKGPIILIMHQYAFLGKGKTIHSSGLLESTMVTVATKWMGSSDLEGLNKTTSRTAGRGLKTKQRDNKQDKR